MLRFSKRLRVTSYSELTHSQATSQWLIYYVVSVVCSEGSHEFIYKIVFFRQSFKFKMTGVTLKDCSEASLAWEASFWIINGQHPNKHFISLRLSSLARSTITSLLKKPKIKLSRCANHANQFKFSLANCKRLRFRFVRSRKECQKRIMHDVTGIIVDYFQLLILF